jgi:hypothetical protein
MYIQPTQYDDDDDDFYYSCYYYSYIYGWIMCSPTKKKHVHPPGYLNK